jgi:hypothetical protein
MSSSGGFWVWVTRYFGFGRRLDELRRQICCLQDLSSSSGEFDFGAWMCMCVCGGGSRWLAAAAEILDGGGG